MNNKVGNEDKIEAHKKSLLHRAFSIFIFNQNKEILLQKRSKNKYHSALLWTNTCCSHPHDGLSTIKCAEIRLKQEMGIETKIKEIFSFIYKESFANGLTEYEYCPLCHRTHLYGQPWQPVLIRRREST